MNIKQITDNLLCSGCGTCNAVCGHQAISMNKTSTMGLLYADVDTDKCTDCGLCLKMCPSSHILEEKPKVTREQIIGTPRACYIGRSLDNEIFSNAQSGGMVTAILTYLFNEQFIDAVVSCRMEYGLESPNVHYTIITSADDLKQNQKSCYTQVDIVSALRDCSQYERIAVVGVPCQIQGISNLMSLKKYSNIKYRIGLVCDKTYCDTYMDAIMYGENRPQGEIRINYRQKNFTYHGKYHSYQKAPTVITNRRGKMTVIPNTKRMYLKEYYVVPKCKICWDKLNTKADIVLGDPWGLQGKYDEKQGDSVIIVRSEQGEKLIADMHSNNLIHLIPETVDNIAKGQTIDLRVSQIRNYDWNQKVESWRNSENKTKQIAVKDSLKGYTQYRLNRQIHRRINLLKSIIIKLVRR